MKPTDKHRDRAKPSPARQTPSSCNTCFTGVCLAGAHDPEDMLQRLSQMCSPIVVTRSQAATVNAAAADRGSPTPQHAFRRLDSADSDRQSMTPGSRFDSFGTPPVQGERALAYKLQTRPKQSQSMQVCLYLLQAGAADRGPAL